MNTFAMLVLQSCLFLGLGCQAGPVTAHERASARPGPSGALADGIVLDGEFDDWDQSDCAKSDGRYVYLTFSPGARPMQAIQAAPYTTRIRIDADANSSTGRAMARTIRPEAMAAQDQGVDLLIELSPKNELGSVGIGSKVTSYSARGRGQDIGHARVGFVCLPTYASEQYEVRLDRLADGAGMLRPTGPIEILVDQIDAKGDVLWSMSTTTKLPPVTEPVPMHAVLPPKPAKSVRVMSTNVLFSSPLQNPQAFRRLLAAVDPDVVLYQEWFNTPRGDVENWLKEYGGGGWGLHFPNEKSGVAIATRRPILARYDSVLPPSGQGRPSRACAALIDTQAGELLAISVHLKCCGSAGSEEDLTRIGQTKSLNAFVREVHKKHPRARLVIAGDFNLVGSRTPMDTLARGLAVDGGDLVAAHPLVLGDNTAVSWVDDKSRFSPGRLDWVLYDPSLTRCAHATLLDSRLLDDESLGAMGLDRDDSGASDHLPVIVDLVSVE